MVQNYWFFLADPGISESKIFFGQGAESAESAASRLAGQPEEGPAFSRPYHHQYHHHSHDCQVTHHQQHKYHKLHPYLQHEWHQQHLRTYHNGSAIMINPYDVVVDVIHVADMDEAYGTYAADDE